MKHARKDYQDRIVDRDNIIPDDEPVMLFRAQDRHFIRVLENYAALVGSDPNVETKLLEAVEGHIDLAHDWQQRHRDRVKSPDLPEISVSVPPDPCPPEGAENA